PDAMNEIFAIQREHGFRARQTFDEMVKNKDIPEHIYSLSLIDPEKRNMGERLFTLVSNADRVKELEDIFVADDRKVEMRNMMNAINSKFSDLNYALGR
ncbi:MAG: hypothetical protein GWO07_05210, partial [Candidatus Dadabacteria bacterium]|nr:hypothetical protein [Candidatus Dadabacteria bacterium]NIU88501.1 hypothetical protein [Nitrosopumilaceae archaeon]NIX15114.1 hypothetical protein [Candidatus Dadabacteria bacterium]